MVFFFYFCIWIFGVHDTAHVAFWGWIRTLFVGFRSHLFRIVCTTTHSSAGLARFGEQVTFFGCFNFAPCFVGWIVNFAGMSALARKFVRWVLVVVRQAAFFAMLFAASFWRFT